jgi:phosphosulfolactate phosphohydrolase-like enzyme
MREWGTGRLARGMYAESYDISDMKYEITLEVDREEIEDDQTDQIKIRIREMADRAATHKDVLLGQLLANGASAGYLAYDGQIFFSNAHVSGKSGTQDNTLAPAAVDKDDPTTAEFRKSIGSAIARLLTLKDDQGEVMSLGRSRGGGAVVADLDGDGDLEVLTETKAYHVVSKYSHDPDHLSKNP